MKTGRKTKRKNMGFAERLQKLVSDRGLTQRQAAAKAGVGLSVLNGWLGGAHPADLLAVQKLCLALSESPGAPVSFEELLTGKKVEIAPVVSSPEDLARVFLKEDDLFDGYVHIKATKVSLKKSTE